MCLSLLRKWFLCRKEEEEPQPTGGIITVVCDGANVASFVEGDGRLQYSLNGQSWGSVSGFQSVSFRNTLYLRGKNSGGVGVIIFNNSVTLEGDLMWLIDYENGSDTVPSGGFEEMFLSTEANMEMTCLATNASADSFANWLNPNSTGILHRPARKNFPDSYYNLPSGWTIVDA